MKKITATVYSETRSAFVAVLAVGYQEEAWGGRMIVTKSVYGYWQVYDCDSRMPIIIRADSRTDAVNKLRKAENDISREYYQHCVEYAKYRQGRIKESEEIISFRLNTMRQAAV